jgi:hypothetical protein
MKVRFVKDALDVAEGKPCDWVFHIDATDLDENRYYDVAFSKPGNKGSYGSWPQRTSAQIIKSLNSLKRYMVFVSEGERIKPLYPQEAVS